MTPSTPHDEERHARALCRRLRDELARCALDATVSVAGEGVHWNCTAILGGRHCETACFDDGDGPEYLIEFSSGATGRTRSMGDVVGAVVAWLSGQELRQLHDRYAFVDGTLRSLRRVATQVIARRPELARATPSDPSHVIGELYDLWFRVEDRSCRVYYFGDNALPEAVFHWDDTELFTVSMVAVEQLAALLSRWLCERAMPSVMQAEMPWLGVGPVALAYERGEGVEGEFLASWDGVAAAYKRTLEPFGANAVAFIARLRESGFDRTLRAGKSVWSMTVSRSRRYGLREGQPWIAFDFTPDEVIVTARLDGSEQSLTVSGFDLPAELIALLERLEERPID